MFIPFRTRTKFERNLFVSILLIALALCTASVLSLVVAQQRFENLLQQLWSQSDSAAMKRDLGFFARHYLNELASCGAVSLRQASADCQQASAETILECVSGRVLPDRQHDEMTPHALQIYSRSDGEWRLVVDRPFDASPDRPDTGRVRLRSADLEAFVQTGVQPLQRSVGFIASVHRLDDVEGHPTTLVLVSAADSTLARSWQRSMANVESPSFAPLFSDLIRLQIVSLLFVLLVVGVIAIAVSRVLSGRVSQPLAELVEAMERVGAGDLDYRATPSGQHEFRLLVESFNDMTARIQQLNEETRHTARIKRELEMARDIQMRLFPAVIPQPDGFDIHGANVPSLEVSGDYFDVLPWGKEGNLALIVGDVTGKGVPAAMVMSNAQACLHSESLRPDSEATDSVGILNHVLCENTDDETFITFFIASLSPSESRLSYVNAGHNPPVLLRQSGDCLELAPGGPIVGILPDAPYKTGHIDLAPGDLLCMYTDGVTEAAMPSGEEFGMERLKDVLHQSKRLSAEEIVGRIVGTVEEFTQLPSQADDITILVVKVADRAAE